MKEKLNFENSTNSFKVRSLGIGQFSFQIDQIDQTSNAFLNTCQVIQHKTESFRQSVLMANLTSLIKRLTLFRPGGGGGSLGTPSKGFCPFVLELLR